MYSFLVACNRNDLRPLKTAMAITGQIMPALGHATRCSWRALPEIGGGWFYYLPDPAPATTLITEELGDRYAVLAFGEVYGEASVARRVLDEWQAGGVRAVRALDGSFSAVILDRAEKTLHVASDVIGRRTLRFVINDGLFLLSTHDVPLVATGLCPLEYDLVSASSTLAVDWSLGGRSMLKAVQPCDPRKVLKWNGRLEEIDDAPIDLRQRLEAGDREGCAVLRDEMIETIRQHAQDMTARSELVRVELTAGLDSRACLGVLQAVATGRLHAYTAGEPGHIDVRVARRIAEKYQVPHSSSIADLPTLEAFLDNGQVYAYFYNGDANAKRAFAPPMVYDRDVPIRIGGGGGEIYRGYYYPDGGSALSKDEALAVLLKKHPRIKRLSWRTRELGDAVRARLANTVDQLAGVADDGYDLLDLFYLFERYSRWSLGARSPQENRHFLYESGPLVRQAFRMPAPVGRHCQIHEGLIRRFLPGVFWWPINGRLILPLEKVLPGSWKTIVRLHRAAERFKRRGAGSPAKSQDQVRADLLGTLLQGELRDRLTYRDSFGDQLLGADTLAHMIDDHVAGKANHLEPLGSLITLELWKGQIECAADRARRSEV